MDIKEIFKLLPDAINSKVPDAKWYGSERKLILYPDGSGRIATWDCCGEDTILFEWETFDELYEFLGNEQTANLDENGPKGFFDVTLKEDRIWNRALTFAECLSLISDVGDHAIPKSTNEDIPVIISRLEHPDG